MASRARRISLGILRFALCAVFITWAVKGVSVYDRVELETGGAFGLPDKPVNLRLLNETPDTVVVQLPDGTSRPVPRDAIAHDENGEEQIERGLLTAFRQTDPRYLLLALVVFTPVPALQSWRLQWMLRAQDIRLSWWQCTKLSFGGNFLNFAFPIGSTAGDVFKAYYTAMHTEHKTEAVTTILLDRFVGLSGLLVVAGVMSFVGSNDPLVRKLGIGALGLCAILFVAAIVLTSQRFVALLPRNLPFKVPAAASIKRIHATAERLVHHKKLLVGVLLQAIVLQFIAVGCGVICAVALHMNFSGNKMWDYFAFIGCGHVIAAIPIAPFGLGTMEAAYKAFFLGEYGTLSQLLCLALWVRILLLVWALPGALVTVLGAYRPRDLKLPGETPIADGS